MSAVGIMRGSTGKAEVEDVEGRIKVIGAIGALMNRVLQPHPLIVLDDASALR